MLSCLRPPARPPRTPARLILLALGLACGGAQAQAPRTGASLALMARDLPFLGGARAAADGCTTPAPRAVCGAPPLAWQALRLQARRDLELGDLRAARAHERAALDLARQAGDDAGALACHAALAVYAAAAGDGADATRELAAARALARADDADQASALQQFAATVHAALGHDAAALASIAAGLEAAAAAHDSRARVFLLALRARLAAGQGNALQASGDLTRAAVAGGQAMRANAARALTLDRGLLDIAAGRKTEALAMLEALLGELEAEGAPGLQIDTLQAVAGALERLGDTARAHALDERAQALVAATRSGFAPAPQSLRRYALHVAPPPRRTRHAPLPAGVQAAVAQPGAAAHVWIAGIGGGMVFALLIPMLVAGLRRRRRER